MSTISDRKLAANRRNARKSTGPKTAAGKATASRNAITHGLLAANNIILDGESKSAFLCLRENFIRSLEPANYIELTLVERIACAQWKLRRLHTLEQQFHHEQLVELHHETLDTLEKMETELNRSSRPRNVPSGPDKRQQNVEKYRQSVKDITSQRVPVSVVQVIQLSHPEGLDQFERLARHEQRLEGSIDKALRELNRLRDAKWKRRKKTDDDYEEDRIFAPLKSLYVTDDATLDEFNQEEQTQSDEIDAHDPDPTSPGSAAGHTADNATNANEPTVPDTAVTPDATDNSATDDTQNTPEMSYDIARDTDFQSVPSLHEHRPAESGHPEHQ